MAKRRFSLINKQPILPLATTVELEDITNEVNLTAKREGTVYRNTTTRQLVIASGDQAGDDWEDSDGNAVHTPI